MRSTSTQYLNYLIKRISLPQIWRRIITKPIMPKYQDSTSDFLKCSIIPPRLQWLLRCAPVFPVHGSQIKVLTHPTKFYDELITRSSNSSKRIVLASLYLGTGDLEKKLVSSISERLMMCKTLRVRWLLDHTRGSRGDPSSRSLLLPMIINNPHNCQVSLYHTPNLRGFLRWIMPQRWNETIGLQHMKIYIFDDSLLISGANLSNDYFTNRQDRYVIFEDCKELSDFYETIIENISHYSFKLQSDNTTAVQPLSGVHPLKGMKDTYCSLVNHTITDLWNKHCNNNAHKLHKLEKQELSDNLNKSAIIPDTVVFPTLQMGPFNINYDDSITKMLLNEAGDKSTIHLASGYFNLTEDYMKCVLWGSMAKFHILCAHPKANGFLGAKGFAGAIPSAYTQLAKLFFNRVIKSKQYDRITLHEYQRDGWTFHGKGLWYYMSGMTAPLLTMIGSPNFGWRSKCRDLESQVILITKNKDLQNNLQNEQELLYSCSSLVSSDTYKDNSRYVPFWVRFVMPVIKAFF